MVRNGMDEHATPPQHSRRRQRSSVDGAIALRGEILDQTLSMLRVTGSEGLSVDRLAEEIGVTKRTIYRHYKSKSDLIIAVVSREVERLCQAIVNPTSGVDDINAIGMLYDWIRGFFDYARMPETLAFMRYLNFEAARDASLQQHDDQWSSLLHDHACKLISAAQQQGSLRRCKPMRLAILLLDLVVSFDARGRYNVHADKFGGDAPDQYFAIRWAAFMSLAAPHPWSEFNQLIDQEPGE